jgi:hypothetical protein
MLLNALIAVLILTLQLTLLFMLLRYLRSRSRLEAKMSEQNTPIETAKEVAGKTIGKQGLLYITVIICVGVGASIVLEESKMAAVMGLLGGALTALISMMNGVAGANVKEEKPEFKVMHDLIERLDKSEVPMRVDVEEGRVTVTKGNDVTTMKG